MEKLQELIDKANYFRVITIFSLILLVIGVMMFAVLRYVFYLPVFPVLIFVLCVILFGTILCSLSARFFIRNKTVTQELLRREELFREFAEKIDAVFWRSSQDLDKVIYVSPAYEKIWGRSRKELYHHPTSWIDGIIPEDKENAIEAFIHRIHQENVDSVQAEYRIRRPDGALRYIYDRGFKIKDSNGNIVGVMGIANDMTSYRLAQIRKRVQKDITNIIKLLNERLTFHEATMKILETIGGSFDWGEGEIWFLNPHENILRRVELWVNPELEASEFDIQALPKMYQFDEGMPGKIWRLHEVDWVTRTENDEELRGYFEVINKLGLVSVIGIPVRHQTTMYGVIVFTSTTPIDPDENLIKMLTAVGEELGGFIYVNQFSEVVWRENI